MDIVFNMVDGNVKHLGPFGRIHLSTYTLLADDQVIAELWKTDDEQDEWFDVRDRNNTEKILRIDINP